VSTNDSLQALRRELENGIGLDKCQKCGCMRETLDNLTMQLPILGTPQADELARDLTIWNARLKAVQYACLGCAYCYPAVAQNTFTEAFPDLEQAPGLKCDFRAGVGWPAVVGDFFLMDKGGHIAVTTLASVALAEELATHEPKGLALVGKTETENIGIDKIVKNVITNPALQYLVVTGKDSAGHQSGRTLLALAENGINPEGRVIGAPGKRPILRNVSAEEVAAFRAQVEVVDLIGCEDAKEIRARVESLSPKAPVPCG
jgi:tetrahydromethanopterin S-methyltransferase subunit A